MNWIIKFTEKGIVFTSDYARATFIDYQKKHPNERYKLSTDVKKSRGQLGFYFAAVIPAYAEWSENFDENNPEHLIQVHELFKGAFNFAILTGLQGKPVRVGKSTTTLNKKEYSAFLERIERYFQENQIPFPDPALYKRWRDMFQNQYPKYRDWLNMMNINSDGSPIELK
jgi:hypothetical protein